MPQRPLYRYADLRRLFAPASVAVVGASTRPGSFGLQSMRNLASFGGTVYPVNPAYPEVEGYACFDHLSALPEVPDCVVVALNREAAYDAVRASVELGVGGVIVYAGGFAETRQEALVALQDRLTDCVAGTPTRLLGPNCLGVTNYADRALMMFGRMPPPEPLGPVSIAVVAQSGSIAMSLGQVVKRGISLSHSIPVGNAADVGLADVISYLVDEKRCDAIACIFEGVTDPERLLEAAELAARADKPLIFYKMAVGEEGAAAALSHTGALAGSYEMYATALEARGAVMVERLEDIVETALFFAKAGAPSGKGPGIVLSTGGLGVIAADKAEAHRVPLLQPEGATLATLEANVPEFGAARNPCDVTAQVQRDPRPLEACGAAFLSNPEYSTLLVVQSYADEISAARIPMWARLAEQHGKVVCNYWTSEWLEGHGAREVESEPRIATFRSLDRCFGAIGAWHRRQRHLERLRNSPARLSAPDARQAAEDLLRQRRGNVIAEREAKQILALYNVPVVAEHLAQDADAAVAAAEALGYPVAMKLESPDVLHKSDVGVIRLSLRSANDARAAFGEIMDRAAALPGDPRIAGVLVQRMVRPGLEFVLGARINHQFGPMVVIGFGGVLIELLHDTVMLSAPVSPGHMREELDRLRGAAAFQGFRGLPAVDMTELCAIAARFSEFVADHADTIREVDVNPLIWDGERFTAVDMLILA